MPDLLDYSRFSKLFQAATRQIRAHQEMLSKLDSAVGDGDHGTTMLRVMEAVENTTGENGGCDLAALFSKVAWAVMSCDGGSTGPLLGSFFMGLSQGAAGKTELDFPAFIACFTSGITQLHKQSRAQVGDKTMMDAFLPALAALKSADSSQGIQAALAQAAQAAAEGAEATRQMRARFGRARNLGDRVLGHPDPGAVSVSLLFKGFAEA